MADKLPKIFLNIDFYQKGRNLRWVKENGFEAIAILQCIWIASSQEKNCKLHTSDALALSFLQQFQDDKLINTINSAVEVGLLERDGDYLYNSQIVSDHKNFEVKRRNYVKGHQKRKQNQDESTVNPERNQDKSKLDFIDTDIEYEPDTEIEIEELNPKQRLLPGSVQPGEFKILTFDAITWEALQMQQEPAELQRSIELAEAYIEKQKHKDPQRYRDLKKEALCGKAFLLSWAKSTAARQLNDEKASGLRAEKAAGTFNPQADLERQSFSKFLGKEN